MTYSDGHRAASTTCRYNISRRFSIRRSTICINQSVDGTIPGVVIVIGMYRNRLSCSGKILRDRYDKICRLTTAREIHYFPIWISARSKTAGLPHLLPLVQTEILKSKFTRPVVTNKKKKYYSYLFYIRCDNKINNIPLDVVRFFFLLK